MSKIPIPSFSTGLVGSSDSKQDDDHDTSSDLIKATGHCTTCHVEHGGDESTGRSFKRRIPSTVNSVLHANILRVLGGTAVSEIRILYLPDYLAWLGVALPCDNHPLGRIPVATCNLTKKLRKRKRVYCYCYCEQQQQQQQGNDGDGDESNDWNVLRNLIVAPYHNLQRRLRLNETHATASLVSESLDSIVAGVISTLVHRRNRIKKTRRHENINNEKKNNNSNNTAHYYYDGSNVLARGFSTVVNPHAPTSSFCATMMSPGIQCSQLNTCVASLKHTPVFRTLHKLLGDARMRDLLSDHLVLLPVDVPRGNYLQLCGPPLQGCDWIHDNDSSPSNSAPASAHNYSSAKTTLTASTTSTTESPPILTKSSKIKSTHATTTTTTTTNVDGNHGKNGHKRKQPSTTTDNTTKTNSSHENNWSPNMALPRHCIFYSDSFVKKVGLPPTHILNRTIESDSESSRVLHDNKLNYDLLNSIVQIEHGNNPAPPTVTNKADDAPRPPHQQRRRRRQKRWTRLRHTGMDMCQRLRYRHSHTDYARLLEKHCPLDDPTIITHDTPVADLVHRYTPTDQVVDFVTAVLRSCFPAPDFWGSSLDTAVLPTLATFLRLRRKEKFPCKDLVRGIRITDMAWLLGSGGSSTDTKKKKKKLTKSEHEATTILTQNVMRWVYCQYLFPLLRATFYITETQFMGNQVVYYRKPVWSKIRNRSIQSLLRGDAAGGDDARPQYLELSTLDAKERLDAQTMGCAKLRIVPKKSGTRPIAVLSKRHRTVLQFEEETASKGETGDVVSVPPPRKRLRTEATASLHSESSCDPSLSRSYGNASSTETAKSVTAASGQQKYNGSSYLKNQSTNSILGQAFDVLKFEYSRTPEKFGAGVLGLDGVLASMRTFSQDLQSLQEDGDSNTATTKQSAIPLYFASVDIHRCYDNINQEHLHTLIQKLVSDEDYIIQKYSVLHPFKSRNKVHRRALKRVSHPENFEHIHTILTASKSLKNEDNNERRYSKSIFIDEVKMSTIPVSYVCSHVFCTNVRFFSCMAITPGPSRCRNNF